MFNFLEGIGQSIHNQKWMYAVLSLIVLLGFFMRYEAVSVTEVDNQIRADAAQYLMYAYNLDVHGIYSRTFSGTDLTIKPKPDAHRSPGYPLMLYAVWEDGELTRLTKRVTHLQALLSSITLVFIFFFANQAVGKIGALAVTMLAALSPHLINMNVYLVSETLFTFFLMFSVMGFVKVIRLNDTKVYYWLLPAVLLACAALVRPVVQYFVIFLAIFLYVELHQKRGKQIAVALLIGFFSIFLLWTIRNLLAIGALSDPTLSISTLHHGMYPDFMYNGDEKSFGYPYRKDPESAFIDESVGNFLSVLFARFIESPWQYIAWYFSKPSYLFQWDIIAGQGDAFVYPTLASPYYKSAFFDGTHTFMKLSHGVLVVLSFVGMVLPWLSKNWLKMRDTERRVLRLVSLLYGYFILVHIVGAPFPRYSIPLRPITYVLAVSSMQIAWAYRNKIMFWKAA